MLEVIDIQKNIKRTATDDRGIQGCGPKNQLQMNKELWSYHLVNNKEKKIHFNQAWV